jgi:hypothetical protein
MSQNIKINSGEGSLLKLIVEKAVYRRHGMLANEYDNFVSPGRKIRPWANLMQRRIKSGSIPFLQLVKCMVHIW